MNNSLLIDNEVLRARLDIRDFFLNNTVREIYENIGQLLSLVRMDLGSAGLNGKTEARMESAGRLVAQSIKDLRLMSKNFAPDADLLQDGGFIECFEKVIVILYQKGAPVLTLEEKKNNARPEVKLIVFSMLLKILVSLKQEKIEPRELSVLFTKASLQIALNFETRSLYGEGTAVKNGISHFKRGIVLIHGKFSIAKKRNGATIWKLVIPLK